MSNKVFSFILMAALFATVLSSCKKDDNTTFTVTFDSKGGTPIPATQIVIKDGMVKKPADPTLTDHQFTGWTTADDETSSLWDFKNGIVTADMTLYAKWAQRLEINGCSVTVLSYGNGIASVTSVTPVEEGMLITLTATANSGYCFIEWNVDGCCTSKDNPVSFIMPTHYPSHDTRWEAIFVQIPTVTVSCDGNGTGSANVTSAWNGFNITLTATANSDYRFLEWQVIKGDITLSSTIDNPTILYMSNENENKAIEVKAIFVPSVGLPESITVNVIESFDEREYENKYKYVYKYDIKNRITECVGYNYSLYNEDWYRNSFSTMDYNADGELVEYYEPGSPSARSTRSKFSKNGNKINFTISYHPTVSIFGNVKGELELNTQGLPVKMTYEGTEVYASSGSNYWNYTTIRLTWQNGNLTKRDWERDWKRENVILDWEKGEIDRVEREEGSSSGTTTYTYDDKKTPFHHLNAPKWFLWWLNYDWNYVNRMNLVGNENNVKTVTQEDGSGITYEYTYNDDGFPITRTWVNENTYTEPQKIYDYFADDGFFYYVKWTKTNTETYTYR